MSLDHPRRPARAVQRAPRWLSWHETRARLQIFDDELLLEFFTEDLLHPAPEALDPFDSAEIEDLAQILKDMRRRERQAEW